MELKETQEKSQKVETVSRYLIRRVLSSSRPEQPIFPKSQSIAIGIDIAIDTDTEDENTKLLLHK